MCTYSDLVGTQEILHRYSVDEVLGEGLDGERKDRRGGRDKCIDGWSEGRAGEKDERRNTIILTLCVCQNPFPHPLVPCSPLRETELESFSVGLIRLTQTQILEASRQPTANGLP